VGVSNKDFAMTITCLVIGFVAMFVSSVFEKESTRLAVLVIPITLIIVYLGFWQRKKEKKRMRKVK